jgi:hypothetical protein
MASLRELLSKGKDYDEKAREVTKKLEKAYPFVAQILGGCKATATAEAIAPGTITFWIHEGKPKFTANIKSAGESFIGEVIDIENPWESVNTAMLLGHVSSKRHSERNSILDAEKNGVKLY